MPLDLEHKPTEATKAATGFLDELRAVYQAIDSDDTQTKVFDVEGTRAAVRYRRMLQEDRLDIARRAREQNPQIKSWEINAQFLIEACEEILGRDPDTDELAPVTPGKRVTFDWQPDSTPLHEVLGVNETDARRSVWRLFQGVDEALLRHAEEVDTWMGAAETTTAEKFAGG